MNLFISPHNDDEALFGSFTLLREKPLVVIVFDSIVQERRGYGITWQDRRTESEDACEVLGCRAHFLGFSDLEPDWDGIRGALALFQAFDWCYAPAIEDGGHEQHNRVGELAAQIFKGKITHYMTYTKAGKSTGAPVPFENAWIRRKLQALTCYPSQIEHPLCAEHFIREQREYYL